MKCRSVDKTSLSITSFFVKFFFIIMLHVFCLLLQVDVQMTLFTYRLGRPSLQQGVVLKWFYSLFTGNVCQASVTHTAPGVWISTWH